MNKKELQRQESNKRIIDSAIVEFADNGYQVATLTDIASNAEVSKGLVTLRFGSKAGLFLELAKVVCHRDLVFTKTEIKDFDEAVDAVIEYSKRIVTENPLISRLVYQYLFAGNIIPDLSRGYVERHISRGAFMPFFEQKKKDGVIRSTFSAYQALSLFFLNCLTLSISTVKAKAQFLPTQDYRIFLKLICVEEENNEKA